MAKPLYSSKFITLEQDEEGIELELGLSEVPLQSEAEMDMDCILYSPKEDQEVLEAITRFEFEQLKGWDPPPHTIEEEHINCATALKCRMYIDHDIPEVASYPQGKGKEIFWTMMFEG